MSNSTTMSLWGTSTPFGHHDSHRIPTDVRAKMATPADVWPPSHGVDGVQRRCQPNESALA
eukprot:948741-Pyramimonas_sp.AAC.1